MTRPEVSAGNPYRARIVRGSDPPKDDPGAREARVDEADGQRALRADALIAAARAEADEIVAATERECQARMAARLLETERACREEIEQVLPQLAGLVLKAVEDILGQRPATEIADLAVRQAALDWPERSVVLHCGLRDKKACATLARQLNTAGLATIDRVVVDPRLSEGTRRLQWGGVSVELGRDVQLAELRRVLSACDAGSGEEG